MKPLCLRRSQGWQHYTSVLRIHIDHPVLNDDASLNARFAQPAVTRGTCNSQVQLTDGHLIAARLPIRASLPGLLPP